MMKHSNTSLFSVGLLFLALVGLAAYSTRTQITYPGELVANVNTSYPALFTAVGGDNFTSVIYEENMQQKDTDYVVASQNDKMNVTLSTDGLKAMCCTYDLVWSWSDDSDFYIANSSKEYVLNLNLNEKYLNSNGTKVSLVTDNNIVNTNVPNNTSESEKQNKILSYQICNLNKNILAKENYQEWNISTQIYNLSNVNQSNLRGKILDGHLVIDNVKCNKND